MRHPLARSIFIGKAIESTKRGSISLSSIRQAKCMRHIEQAAEMERARICETEQARHANAIAICLHCQNPFGFGAVVITDDVKMCHICLD